MNDKDEENNPLGRTAGRRVNVGSGLQGLLSWTSGERPHVLTVWPIHRAPGNLPHGKQGLRLAVCSLNVIVGR